MVFYAQGGSRIVWGRKGAVQGSQMDPLDGPIAGLVEGDTFYLDPQNDCGWGSGGIKERGWTHATTRPMRENPQFPKSEMGAMGLSEA